MIEFKRRGKNAILRQNLLDLFLMKNYRDIILALAGVCQSAKLIHQLATEGRSDSDAFSTALESLFVTQPQRIEDVFGGEVRHLKLGLETLIHQLNAQGDENLTRYWISLLALEGKLNKNTNAKQELGQRIARLQTQRAHYEPTSEMMLSIMATIYSDVISPLGRKINILGSPVYLQQELVQHKIRAMLLAGIRSAVLWRQMGGSKWQVLFFRRKLLATAKELYSSIY